MMTWIDRRADRYHPEDGRRDQRAAFQRDRDRVLYSSAFRRLAGVTQVVGVHEGHQFHNRLTHTLKVAQIARRIAEHLRRSYPAGAEALGLDAEVAEAAALAHDIGHPPYGHIAEEQLCELVDRHWKGSPSQGFEGNAQSFRIVTQLSLRSLEHPGLNLTRATLGAILKYPWPRASDPKVKAFRKWGAYESERELLRFAAQFPPGQSRSPEAEIMDWSDDIAYSVHDLEDFWKVGLIPLSRLTREDSFRDAFLRDTAVHWWDRQGTQAEAVHAMAKTAEELLRLLPAAMHETYDGSSRQRAQVRSWTSFLIGRYVRDAVSLESGGEANRIRIEPAAMKEIALLKTLTRRYAIFNPTLSAQQYGQRKLIERLFVALMEMIAEEGSHSVLPPRLREALEAAQAVTTDSSSRHNAALRAVVDFISSLTEPEAQAMDARLSGREWGLLSDPIVR